MVHDRIEMNPEIMGGKPVIRGTRVPVETILRKLGAGLAPVDILADHPRLTDDDIHAAQAFAANSRGNMTSHLDRITSDSAVLGGRPCIRGMRVRVKDILDLLASGASRAEILRDYPYLEGDDIAAALEYAAQ